MVFAVSLLFADNGQINFLIGDVKMQQPGKAEWQKVSYGLVVPQEAKIKTGKESRCEVLLPDGSVVKILENTEMKFEKMGKTEQEESSFFSAFGEIFFKVKKMLNRKFTLKTPVAVMSVRGTEFYVINSPRGNGLWVNDGKVAFSTNDGKGTVIVPAGKKSTLLAGGTPSMPQALSPVEQKLLKEIRVVQKPAMTPPTQKPQNKPQKKEPMGQGEQPANIDYTDQQPGVAPTIPPDTQGGSGSSMFHMGGQVGAVTIDGKMHTQIGLRPEFVFGKLGIGLDLTIYMDGEGNINTNNWDSAEDIIHKFMYIRWAQRGDPFYFRVGAINNYTLGFGSLINHYSNTVRYPDRIYTGMFMGLQGEKFGAEIMVNDFGESFRQGGFYAFRLTYNIIGGLTIGGSVVYDHNQYKSLEDRDGDDVPDAIDDFPDDKDLSVDTDGDGIPDTIDPDRDGNGYTDNSQDPNIANNDTYFDPANLKIPFDINNAPNASLLAYSIDLSYPIVRSSLLSLDVYADYSQFANTDNKGWGVTAPGFMGKIGFLEFSAAYRIMNKHYIPEYFNATYELERVKVFGDSLVPKSDMLKAVNENVQGFLISAGFDIFNLVHFSAGYQDMKGETFKYRTLRGNLDVNTSFIPKITQAGAYYYDQNVKDLFKKNPGVIMGVKLGYEIASGAALVVDYRLTYVDLDGNGFITGNEEVRTTNISTVVQF